MPPVWMLKKIIMLYTDTEINEPVKVLMYQSDGTILICKASDYDYALTLLGGTVVRCVDKMYITLTTTVNVPDVPENWHDDNEIHFVIDRRFDGKGVDITKEEKVRVYEREEKDLKPIKGILNIFAFCALTLKYLFTRQTLPYSSFIERDVLKRIVNQQVSEINIFE